jgi:hypothetical protein
VALPYSVDLISDATLIKEIIGVKKTEMDY